MAPLQLSGYGSFSQPHVIDGTKDGSHMIGK